MDVGISICWDSFYREFPGKQLFFCLPIFLPWLPYRYFCSFQVEKWCLQLTVGETELVAPWKASSTLKHCCDLRAPVVPSVTVYGGGENWKHLQGTISSSAEIDNIILHFKIFWTWRRERQRRQKVCPNPRSFSLQNLYFPAPEWIEIKGFFGSAQPKPPGGRTSSNPSCVLRAAGWYFP